MVNIRSSDIPAHLQYLLTQDRQRPAPVQQPVKRNKYNVSPPEERHYCGRTYDSKAEMLYAKDLYAMRDIKVIRDFMHQPRMWLGIPEDVYVPDFLVIPAHDNPHYVDVKGVETAKFKHDFKLFMKYGCLPLHIVKRKGGKFHTTVHVPERLR